MYVYITDKNGQKQQALDLSSSFIKTFLSLPKNLRFVIASSYFIFHLLYFSTGLLFFFLPLFHSRFLLRNSSSSSSSSSTVGCFLFVRGGTFFLKRITALLVPDFFLVTCRIAGGVTSHKRALAYLFFSFRCCFPFVRLLLEFLSLSLSLYLCFIPSFSFYFLTCLYF